MSFFNEEKPETAVSKWARARTRAAKVICQHRSICFSSHFSVFFLIFMEDWVLIVRILIAGGKGFVKG